MKIRFSRTLVLGVVLSLCTSVKGEFSIDSLSWAKDVGARTAPMGREIYNVAAFGAKPDGISLNTQAIQAAIDECYTKGGGVVSFPEGRFLTGSVFVKSGVKLLIPEGTTLLGSTDISHYPKIATRIAGIEMEWPAALINVIDQKNASVEGKGTVFAQGKLFWDKYWTMRKDYEKRGLRWIVDYDCDRPRTLLVQNSEDVSIKGLTFQQAGFWTIQLLYSSHCTVEGVVIQNNVDGHGPSTDGIDIDSSSRILVEKCDIDCNDDNFCLKAGRDADGLRVNKPTEYIVIRHCISRAGGGLLTCGSETSGGIRYVLAHDLTAKGTSIGLRFKSAMNRGGTTEHIYIKDVKMEKVGIAIEATMNWNPTYSYSTLPKEYEGKSVPIHWTKMLERVDEAKGTPYFKEIHLSGIYVKEARVAVSAEGSERSWLEAFSLSDIDITTRKAGHVRWGRNWKMNNVRLNSEDTAPIKVENSEGVNFPPATTAE